MSNLGHNVYTLPSCKRVSAKKAFPLIICYYRAKKCLLLLYILTLWQTYFKIFGFCCVIKFQNNYRKGSISLNVDAFRCKTFNAASHTGSLMFVVSFLYMACTSKCISLTTLPHVSLTHTFLLSQAFNV